jgi:hypothetical protein
MTATQRKEYQMMALIGMLAVFVLSLAGLFTIMGEW